MIPPVPVTITYADGRIMRAERLAARRIWSCLELFIMSEAETWIDQPLTLDDNRNGLSVQYLVRLVNSELRELRRLFYEYERLDGWEIHAFNPEENLAKRTVIFIAVDPNGVGHNIASLADGQYETT